MKWLDEMLAECKKDHVVAIVHLHSFPMPNGGYYDQTSANFWQSQGALNTVYGQVADLARHLRGYGSEFAAYDILSEPTLRVGKHAEQPPGWPGIQDRIIRTIRAIDPQRWIVVKPGPWGGAGGYSDFQPPDFPRLVYSLHIYAPHVYTHQGIRGFPLGTRYPGAKVRGITLNKQALENFLTPVVRFQQRYRVPMWVGEFGAVRWAPGSDEYLEDLVSIFDSHNWGWSYFGIGSWHGWDPNYDTSYTLSWKQALAHRVGTKSKRWATLRAMFKENGGGG